MQLTGNVILLSYFIYTVKAICRKESSNLNLSEKCKMQLEQRAIAESVQVIKI